MIEYLNWAASLEGVSPVARLLAMLMANNVSTGEIEIDRAVAWIDCTETELLLASTELVDLKAFGIEGRKVKFDLPAVVDFHGKAIASQDILSIYVIVLSPEISKIGVSRNTQTRLANLQASNPVQQLSIAWKFAGASTQIRRAEWLAHKQLKRQSLGNEWFRVGSERAIEVVKAAIDEART